MSRITVTFDGLKSVIEPIVDERLAEALGARLKEDPWLDSAAAADYLGVKRQRIHDLVCSGELPRLGEKGERLYFRRSTLDAYREGRSLKRGMDLSGAGAYWKKIDLKHDNASLASFLQ